MHWEAMKAAEERDRAEAVLPLTKPALIVNGHMHGDVGNVQLNFGEFGPKNRPTLITYTTPNTILWSNQVAKAFALMDKHRKLPESIPALPDVFETPNGQEIGPFPELHCRVSQDATPNYVVTGPRDAYDDAHHRHWRSYMGIYKLSKKEGLKTLETWHPQDPPQH